MELQRILPILAAYDFFIYIDEIVSGGMMTGHLKEMFVLGVQHHLPMIAVGLADGFGNRSEQNRLQFEYWREHERLHAFLWEGCHTLITEDQKFLLGMHYADYNLGPHAVPLFDESLIFFPEKTDFDRCCFGQSKGGDTITQAFCATS